MSVGCKAVSLPCPSDPGTGSQARGSLCPPRQSMPGRRRLALRTFRKTGFSNAWAPARPPPPAPPRPAPPRLRPRAASWRAVRGHRHAAQRTLVFIALLGLDQVELGRRVDAAGDRTQSRLRLIAISAVPSASGDRAPGRGLEQGRVELDLVHRQPAQLQQGRGRPAEPVEDEVHALFLKPASASMSSVVGARPAPPRNSTARYCGCSPPRMPLPGRRKAAATTTGPATSHADAACGNPRRARPWSGRADAAAAIRSRPGPSRWWTPAPSARRPRPSAAGWAQRIIACTVISRPVAVWTRGSYSS